MMEIIEKLLVSAVSYDGDNQDNQKYFDSILFLFVVTSDWVSNEIFFSSSFHREQ